jgi:hypothetical protein
LCAKVTFDVGIRMPVFVASGSGGQNVPNGCEYGVRPLLTSG